ncbi:TolC family protein [Dyella tabacisoli]|uniref:TolC family protein n=1 Tax=Dyella tabacisoli TaxID=2282381 RepID=UPI001CDB91C3|nr:TolC family protein [Dyella tabacisoli]
MTAQAGPSADLTRAVRALWTGNPEVQVARAELEAARARARAAHQPLYNPSLELAAENADVDRRTIGVSLALDLSGKRRARGAVGDAELDVAQAAYEVVRRDVAARWLKVWFETTLVVQESRLGQRRVELMARFAELAERRLKVGDISSTERDLAALALTEAQAQQAALLGKAPGVQASLAALGGPADASLPTPPRELPPMPRDDAAVAMERLPEWRLAQARTSSADASVRAAQRDRIPDPTIALTGGRVRTGSAAGMSQNVVGVSLSVPLPIRNNYRAEVDAARAESDAAAAGFSGQRLTLRARANETSARYRALREASAAFRGGRAAAFDERTGLLERLWGAGEIGTSDYLVQLKQSLDTALSGMQLENETWQAWIDYLGAHGQLTAWGEGRDDEGDNKPSLRDSNR